MLLWYDQNARDLPWRKDIQPYHILLSEIMLQQTRAEVVKGYYTRFLEEIPTLEALARVDEDKLLKLWEGLGYYSRARNLQKAARQIVQELQGRFPSDYNQILKLPGVGAYTAGAIASICFNAPTPAVDGNVLRVIARVAGIYEAVDIPAVKKRFTVALAERYPAARCGDFTQSLIELGATVCLPKRKPRCDACPLATVCRALSDNTVTQLPVKLEKKAKKEQEITLFVFRCGSKLAINRRARSGLLAGLWEFPNVQEKLGEQQAMAIAGQWGTQPVALTKTVCRAHVFTHIRWQMTCYYIDCTVQSPQFLWVDQSVLARDYALPTAFRMFFDQEETAQNCKI